MNEYECTKIYILRFLRLLEGHSPWNYQRKLKVKMRGSTVIRGYDKLFNLREVPYTHVRIRGSLVHLVTTTDVCRWTSGRHWKHEQLPHNSNTKIKWLHHFIAVLLPSQLVVTPKHSLCFHNDSEKSHAVVGERWLEKHLKDKGKEELAKTLWDDNLTAIAEVCRPFSLLLHLLTDVHSYAMTA